MNIHTLRRAACGALALASLASSAAFGQAPPPPPPPGMMRPGMGGPGMGRRPGMGGRQSRMLAQLNLTPAQKAKLQKMQDSQRPKMMALFQNNSLSPEVKRQKMMAMRADSMKKMMAVLTPAQQAKAKAMMAQRGPGMMGGGGMRRPGMPPGAPGGR